MISNVDNISILEFVCPSRSTAQFDLPRESILSTRSTMLLSLITEQVIRNVFPEVFFCGFLLLPTNKPKDKRNWQGNSFRPFNKLKAMHMMCCTSARERASLSGIQGSTVRHS